MIQFVENLNGLGEWLWTTFGRISIEVAILAAIVAVAIALLRIKRPAIRYAFWSLVLIKPVFALAVASCRESDILLLLQIPVPLGRHPWPTNPGI